MSISPRGDPCMMCRLTLLALLAAVVAGPTWAAMMVGPDGQVMVGPDGNPMRQTSLEASCSGSIERFCPELSAAPGQTRNEIICLRPYRSSLSPFCRKAIDAAGK